MVFTAVLDDGGKLVVQREPSGLFAIIRTNPRGKEMGRVAFKPVLAAQAAAALFGCIDLYHPGLSRAALERFTGEIARRLA